jgi:hypothetical protein
MVQLERALTLAVVTLLAGCGNEANQQSAVAAAASNASQPAAEVAVSPKPRALDPKATQLERIDFEGLPASEVLDAVMRLNPTKDKYESDAQRAKRMKEAEGSPLLEGIKVSDLIGFSPTKVHFQYDANRQEWQYEVSPSEVGLAEFSNVEVYSQNLPQSQFPEYAQVYPGRQLVFKRSIHLHVASMKGLSYLVGAVKVPRGEARELEDRLTVLLVGRLTPVRVTSDKKLPIHYDQNEVNIQTALDFKLEGVWLVNKLDGRVLSKAWKVKRLA